ncbi:MAG TPA: hypothetical protein ENK10_02225 [Acidobacteria bacterium]|nr:hypothetical protein [Acidobacteriota bacterium]
MRSPARVALVLLLAAVIGLPALTLTWAGVTIYRAGDLSVEVSEPGAGGGDVHVVLPAGLIELALAVTPCRVIPRQAREQIAPHAELIGELADALGRLPDALFVAVDRPGGQIRIARHDSHLLIRVIDGERRVELQIPSSTLGAVLRYARAAAS